MIASPFTKNILQCQDCKKSWKYPAGNNPYKKKLKMRAIKTHQNQPALPSDVGKYQYDYVIPGDVIGPIYFEFAGTMEGLPVLGRATIDKRWI